MSTMKPVTTDVGIITGRFQVHELHEAHLSLIDTVLEKHDTVLIFIGLSPIRGSTHDPLDFASRKRMINETYPEIDVHYIEDQWSDEVWSKNFDHQIGKLTKPHQTVTLYGSRDSFIPHYTGKYPTVELESTSWISGTEIRRRIASNFKPTKDYRAGVIAASYDRWPGCYSTVDVAVVDWKAGNVLLVRKPTEDKLRFPGGFSSPKSVSYESDARREVVEETGIEAGDYTYIGSTLIDDWRYRTSVDKIKTLMFVATYVFGRPNGQDDVVVAKWVSINDLLHGRVEVVDEHVPLVEMFATYISKNLTKIQDEKEITL